MAWVASRIHRKNKNGERMTDQLPDPLTLAYQSYEAAKKAGDELEEIRLWAIFLDMLNAQKSKVPADDRRMRA